MRRVFDLYWLNGGWWLLTDDDRRAAERAGAPIDLTDPNLAGCGWQDPNKLWQFIAAATGAGVEVSFHRDLRR